MSATTNNVEVLLVTLGVPDPYAQLPRMLKNAGCVVDVLCRKRPALYDRSIRNWYSIDDDMIRSLEARLNELSYAWVILGDDDSLRHVRDASLHGLSKQALPVRNAESIQMLGSKIGLSRFCSEHAIPTPRFSIVTPLIAESEPLLDFPCLVKVDQSSGGRGVYVCNDRADIERIASPASTERRDLLTQEYIRGDVIAIEALYRDGEILAHGTSRVTKTLDNEFGVSVERIFFPCPEIEPLLRSFGRAAGVHGFATMTCMRDDAGRYLLIEADLRPQAWFHLNTHAGTDFTEAIRRFVSSAAPPDAPLRTNTTAMVIHFPRDLLRCMQIADVRGILKWFANADGRWRFLPSRDMRAFLHIIAPLTIRALYITYRKHLSFLRPILSATRSLRVPSR